MNLKKKKTTFNCNIAEKHKKTSKQLPLKKTKTTKANNHHHKQTKLTTTNMLSLRLTDFYPTMTPELSIGVKSAVALLHLQQYISSPAPETFGSPIFQPPLGRGHAV